MDKIELYTAMCRKCHAKTVNTVCRVSRRKGIRLICTECQTEHHRWLNFRQLVTFDFETEEKELDTQLNKEKEEENPKDYWLLITNSNNTVYNEDKNNKMIKKYCQNCRTMTFHELLEQIENKVKLICNNCGFRDEVWHKLDKWYIQTIKNGIKYP